MKNRLTLISRSAVIAVAISVAAFAAAATAPAPKKDAAPAQAAPAKGKPNGAAEVSAADKKFMMKAAKGGMMEVAMGQMAADKAQSAEVKKIGKMMIADHTKANNELMALAKARGVVLSAPPKMGGWKSDKDYLAMMAMDHEKDLAEFRNEAQNGKDPEVKQFANKTSAVIQRHLERVKGVQGKMKS